MIAVVTGASGFIGRNLVGRLRDEGHEVRCLTRATSRSTAGDGTRVDLGDPASVAACVALDGADVVFHLAGATRARSADAFAAANVTPTRNLLGALEARRQGTTRFVYVSSQAAAGPAASLEHPTTESDEPRPVEEYGRSKLQAEREVERHSGRIPWTIVRPCSVMGPFDRDFLPLFQLARTGLLVYPGVRDHWLSLLHVSDVVSGLLAAAQRRNAEGRVFFLGSKVPLQWRELGSEIGRAVGRRVRHLNVPAALVRAGGRIGDMVAALSLETPLLNSSKVALARHPFWVCSSAQAERDLEWKQARSLPDAVRDTYLWYQQSGWLGDSARGAVAVS